MSLKGKLTFLSNDFKINKWSKAINTTSKLLVWLHIFVFHNTIYIDLKRIIKLF